MPPGTGIVHQVNLEYLATGVLETDGVAYPDSLVGTDSHTTMINGLGVLGWGVGGIEAEAAMLGQPLYMLIPQVVGFKLRGQLKEGTTATDLVLRVVEMLRQKGVVGKFVEFYGDGLTGLSLPDRATIANMAPEYGATMGYFPVDDETLRYMERTGRSKDVVAVMEAYYKEQGLFRTDDSPEAEYSDSLELDIGTVEPALSGPKRPQDRVNLSDMKSGFAKTLRAPIKERGFELDDAALTAKGNINNGVPGRNHARQCGHRRDNLLHEYLQSRRHDRRGTAGQESRRKRTQCQALRQDQSRSRIPRRDGLSEPGRPQPTTWKNSAFIPWVMVARPASAIPVPFPSP